MLGSCAAGAQRLWLQLHARATRVGAAEPVAAPRETGSLELRPCCRFCLRRDCPHSSTLQRRSTEPSVAADVALRPKVAEVAAACVAQPCDAVVEVSSEQIEAVELVTPVDNDADRIWAKTGGEVYVDMVSTVPVCPDPRPLLGHVTCCEDEAPAEKSNECDLDMAHGQVQVTGRTSGETDGQVEHLRELSVAVKVAAESGPTRTPTSAEAHVRECSEAYGSRQSLSEVQVPELGFVPAISEEEHTNTTLEIGFLKEIPAKAAANVDADEHVLMVTATDADSQSRTERSEALANATSEAEVPAEAAADAEGRFTVTAEEKALSKTLAETLDQTDTHVKDMTQSKIPVGMEAEANVQATEGAAVETEIVATTAVTSEPSTLVTDAAEKKPSSVTQILYEDQDKKQNALAPIGCADTSASTTPQEESSVFAIANMSEEYLPVSTDFAAPCKQYVLDLRGKNFGDCKCGFSKAEHQVTSPGRIAFRNIQLSTQTPPGSPTNALLQGAQGPCGKFRIDLESKTFGDCKCGFSKSAHSCATTFDSLARTPSPGSPQRHAVACALYRLDIWARASGDCKCGFPKSAHRLVPGSS